MFKKLSWADWRAAVAPLLLTAAWAVAPQAHALADADFEPAFANFIRSADGDESAIEKSAQAFARLSKSEPSNPVVLAYAGASTARLATTTLLPWKKMSYAEDGLSLIDKALGMLNPSHNGPVQRGVPGVLEVKLVAANAFLAVPSFMNRGERGDRLLNEVLNSSLFQTSPLGFKAATWMAAGKHAQNTKNTAQAKRYYKLVIEQKAEQAPQAEALLKGLGA